MGYRSRRDLADYADEPWRPIHDMSPDRKGSHMDNAAIVAFLREQAAHLRQAGHTKEAHAVNQAASALEQELASN